MPLKVQVAFQGGGAKLCDLLAAAQVIQELEQQGKIQVTRTAGTSAGAIVACLLGIKDPIGVSIQRLKNKGREVLDALGPVELNLSLLWKLYRGWPIFNDKPLRRLLEHLFEGYRELGELNRPTFVVAADILMGRTQEYVRPSDPLISSIMDSCGIPYFFRSPRNSPGLVDGGICENLPSSVLQQGTEQFGPIVGISFESAPQAPAPENFLEFAKLLVNTSINNSIARAARSLGSNSVHLIQTDIDTFDFHKALQALEGQHFELVKLRCLTWFENFLLASQGKKSEQIVLVGSFQNPQPFASDLMNKVATLYASQSLGSRPKILETNMIVTAYSMVEKGAPYYGSPDLLRTEYKIQPVEVPLPCFSLAMGCEEPATGPTTWTVMDPDNQDCPFVAIPMNGENVLGKLHFKHENTVALFFTPPLPVTAAGERTYKIIQQDTVFDSMKSIASEKRDFMFIVNRKPVSFKRVNLVLYVPERVNAFDVKQYDGNLGVEIAAGRAMTLKELNSLGTPPPGFRAVGWTSSGVQPESAAAAWFIAP
jgi:predicted acylesterase/phospholipase RssA